MKSIALYVGLVVSVSAVGQTPMEETDGEPQTEEASSEPQMDEASSEAPMEEASAEPQMEEASSEPPMEEASSEPPMEEASIDPPMDDVSSEPPVEEASNEPAMEEASNEPAMEEASNEPAMEEASNEPPMEEANSDLPMADANGEPPNEGASGSPPMEESNPKPPMEEASSKPPIAQAQAAAPGSPVEGRDFVRLSSTAPVNLTPDKKIDVVVFFWYGCPQCNNFEPLLEAWIKRLPPDVSFRRVHVGFGPPHQIHQKLHYALEEMGVLPTMHPKVFAAMNAASNQRQLLTDSDILAFGNEIGIDGARLVATMKSFGVNTKAARARQFTEIYKIDGVPALGVQGRFYTSGSLAGSLERMLVVADFLIARARTETAP